MYILGMSKIFERIQVDEIFWREYLECDSCKTANKKFWYCLEDSAGKVYERLCGICAFRKFQPLDRSINFDELGWDRGTKDVRS